MVERIWKPVLFSVSLLALAWGSFALWQKYQTSKVGTHVAVANEHKGEAATLAAGATASTVSANALTPLVISDTAEIQKLGRELAALKARTVPGPIPPPSPEVPAPAAAPVPDLSPVVAKLEELVAAQDTKIGHLESKVTFLESASEQWHRAHDAKAMEAASLRLALDAKDSAMKAGIWKARIGGMAVGFGSGFAAGVWAGRR